MFVPECEHSKGYFWEIRSCVLGVVFPLDVYMSVHPICSSTDLHLAGREALKAKDCEH